jgi:uncharacterized UPF0160 family protein
MRTIKIQGVYTKEAGNFFVNSIAKYVRDNNYPNWYHQLCDIITDDGRVFNYIISRDDKHANLFEKIAAYHAEGYWKSSGVIYRVVNTDFEMLIDGHYYWATI